MFGPRVGRGVRGEAFVRLDEVRDDCSSKDWGAYGAWEWPFLLLLCDGEGQGLDELPLFVGMLGLGVGTRSSSAGGCGLP